MSQAALFAYAGARLLARHGNRPTPDDWERLGRSRDFGHYLQGARATGLGPFVRNIGTHADGHEVERSLLTGWLDYVHRVAGWQPAAWRPPLQWLAVVPELPAFGHVLAQRPDHPWMAELPVLGPALELTGQGRRRALAAGPAGALLADGATGGDLWQRALAEWHRRLPRRPNRFQPALAALETALAAYVAEVSEGSGAAEQRLERVLVRTLRRHPREPAAAYAHLGLVALDLQRLRRELLLRRLLPEQAA